MNRELKIVSPKISPCILFMRCHIYGRYGCSNADAEGISSHLPHSPIEMGSKLVDWDLNWLTGYRKEYCTPSNSHGLHCCQLSVCWQLIRAVRFNFSNSSVKSVRITSTSLTS